MNLPESTLVKKQEKKLVKVRGKFKYELELRYDDSCGNGHNSFSIILVTYEKTKGDYRFYGSSPACEEIENLFPGYGKFNKWHLCSSDGPMHYVSNTLWHVSNKDCWGGLKGTVRWYKYNVRVNNALVFPEDAETYTLLRKKEAEEMAERIQGEIVPVPWVYHEGKDRDLDAARNAAIWPEATDEELMSDDLEAMLLDRLPALMQEFKSDMEELGFTY